MSRHEIAEVICLTVGTLYAVAFWVGFLTLMPRGSVKVMALASTMTLFSIALFQAWRKVWTRDDDERRD